MVGVLRLEGIEVQGLCLQVPKLTVSGEHLEGRET